MDINGFVKYFADQFDETDPSEIEAGIAFHDLDEWSSLTALSVINMVEKKCGVGLSFDDIKRATTIEDLFHIIEVKK